MAVPTRPSAFDVPPSGRLSIRRLLGISFAALVGALCFAATHAGPAAAQEPIPEPFVIGGSDAVLGEIPHQVGVFIRANADGTGFLCGGSIISEDAIVTAAHCVDFAGLDPVDVFVFAGSLTRFDQVNGQLVRGSEVFVHPDYQGGNDFDDDVAVVKLATPLTLNNNVQAIELATDADFVAGESVRVSGWGQTTDGGSTATTLQTVMIDLYGDADCNAIRANAGAGPISNAKEICAGIPGQDACRGDSGGPLTVEANGERRLLGVVSHGLVPCATFAPGVYAEVAFYRDWIIDQADLAPPPLGTQITSPVNEAALDCGNVALQWVDNSDEFWVYAGRSVGDNDYFDSLSLDGSTTSTVMTGLPNDGSTVHVRLWHRNAGESWSSHDVTYTACSDLSAAIATPSPSSTLDCGVVEVSWTGTADEYWLFAGDSVGSSSYFNSGSLVGSSVSVVGLPGDGSTVHMRFFYRATAGQWAQVDATYTACTSMATIIGPTPGATLPCSEAPMSWTGDADEYWVYAGPNPGSNEYFNSGSLSGSSTTITGLPADGSTIHVRLYFRSVGAVWESVDATYAACTRMASVTAPTANSVVCGDMDLSWSGDADEYWIYAGSSEGASDYLDSDSLGGATSLTISDLPQDGSTIHVRLWFRASAGEWTWVDVTYTACSAAV